MSISNPTEAWSGLIDLEVEGLEDVPRDLANDLRVIDDQTALHTHVLPTRLVIALYPLTVTKSLSSFHFDSADQSGDVDQQHRTFFGLHHAPGDALPAGAHCRTNCGRRRERLDDVFDQVDDQSVMMAVHLDHSRLAASG